MADKPRDPPAPAVLPRAVFFDAGDTLLDTSEMLDHALFTALVPIDPTRNLADVRAAVTRSGEALPARQPPYHESRGNARWWVDRYRRVGEELGLSGEALTRFVTAVSNGHFAGDALRVVPDAPAALGRLVERGIPLGVISNWDDTLESILERKGLHRYFEVFVASTAIHRAKPDRRIFEHALARLGAPANGSWHVGDDPSADALGAARAGLAAVLLDPFDLYAQLDRKGIVRVKSLTAAVDRILGPAADTP